MLREVMPIIAGGGVGLVLALFLRLYCVRCVAGSRATQLDAGGMGAGVVFPPCVCCYLFFFFFCFFVVGEEVGVVGGAISCQFTTVLYICGMKIISVTNYAKSIGVTRQAIIKRIKMNNPLPGVKSYYKTGGKTSHYILILE